MDAPSRPPPLLESVVRQRKVIADLPPGHQRVLEQERLARMLTRLPPELLQSFGDLPSSLRRPDHAR